METFSASLALCAGNSPVPGEFPAQRPMTRSFDVFFDLRLNKRLSKQPWGWWFETLSRPLWRHCNVAHHDTHYIPVSLWLHMSHFLRHLFRHWWSRRRGCHCGLQRCRFYFTRFLSLDGICKQSCHGILWRLGLRRRRYRLWLGRRWFRLRLGRRRFRLWGWLHR